MDFYIDAPPPLQEDIDREKQLLDERIHSVKTKDMILTAIIVIFTSTVVALMVYWLTNSIKFAAISASIYPVISIVLNLFGITTNTGFRSATMRLIELNNSYISLKPVAGDNADIPDLAGKYKEIASYVEKVRASGRDFVNGELAMFWEFDAGTQAKTARARNWVNKARGSIDMEEGEQGQDDDTDGFVLDGEPEQTK